MPTFCPQSSRLQHDHDNGFRLNSVDNPRGSVRFRLSGGRQLDRVSMRVTMGRKG